MAQHAQSMNVQKLILCVILVFVSMVTGRVNAGWFLFCLFVQAGSLHYVVVLFRCVFVARMHWQHKVRSRQIMRSVFVPAVGPMPIAGP